MMSTENLLGEPKEAEHSNPRSLKESIQIELEQHALENLKFGLGVSAISAAILFPLTTNQLPCSIPMDLAGQRSYVCTDLHLVVAGQRQPFRQPANPSDQRRHYYRRQVCMLFYGVWLHRYLFNPQQLETSALTS